MGSKFLTGTELVYFIPNGILHYLPLHALELDGVPLIKQHAVAYSHSVSLLKRCLNKSKTRIESCASFGVCFEKEAKRVADIFNVEAIIGSRANKETLKENCDKDIIRFSCHGVFNEKHPLLSGIYLHGDELLTAKEIFSLRFKTDLVALSACKSGISERSSGDDLVGLTRALMYAGAPSVLVSQWSVDDESTQELMGEFYSYLKGGTDKATALQKAQIKVMDDPNLNDVFFWAPFILVGVP